MLLKKDIDNHRENLCTFRKLLCEYCAKEVKFILKNIYRLHTSIIINIFLNVTTEIQSVNYVINIFK